MGVVTHRSLPPVEQERKQREQAQNKKVVDDRQLERREYVGEVGRQGWGALFTVFELYSCSPIGTNGLRG